LVKLNDIKPKYFLCIYYTNMGQPYKENKKHIYIYRKKNYEKLLTYQKQYDTYKRWSNYELTAKIFRRILM